MSLLLFSDEADRYENCSEDTTVGLQPSKNCPGTECALENCGSPTLRLGKVLNFFFRSAAGILFLGQQRSKSSSKTTQNGPSPSFVAISFVIVFIFSYSIVLGLELVKIREVLWCH